MRRREFIRMLGAAAVVAPVGARGQTASKAPRRVVILSPDAAPAIADFREGLRELGYVEGRDIELDIRSADARFDRLPGMADELARGNPDAIVALTTTAATALHHATETIPIIALIAVDPVAA